MNSYSLAINGSWLLFILLALVIIGVSVYSYRSTNPPITGGKRALLLTLRIVGLLLLLFAIFQPIVTNSYDEVIEPRIAFLIDNSESVAIKDASIDRKTVFKDIVAQIANKSDNEGLFFTFDDKVKDLPYDSLGSLIPRGNRSDLAKPFRELSYRQDTSNVQAVVMITDGAYNTGDNPFYDAQSFGKPVFTIGIGDTNKPKDLKIADLISNEISYLNTPTPIFVNLDADGISEKDVNVKVFANGKLIGEEKVHIDKSQSRYKLKFSFTPDKPGNYKISTVVDNLSEEITTKNNSKSDIVKVLENKKAIALFAGRPNYDVSFIVQELSKDKNRELHKYVQKKGGEFYDEFRLKDLQSSEMIVLIGFPNSSTDTKYLELIKKELDRGKPILFMSSNDLDYKKLSLLGNHLPFKILSEGKTEMKVLPSVNVKEVGSSILRVDGDASDVEKWNGLPPIAKTETFIKPNPEASVLMNYSFGNSTLNEPLILSSVLGNKRSIYMLGYGFYKWKLQGYAEEVAQGKTDAIDLYSQLIDNSVRWLSIDNNFDSFVLKTNKHIYTEGEIVEFIAQLYDDSYFPVDGAKVELTLNEANSKPKEILLKDMSNGQYYYKMENLSSGDYSYDGKASISGNVVGRKSGRFITGELNPEYSNLTMNSKLLKSISQATGGQFYSNQLTDLFDQIKSLKNFKDRYVSKKQDYALWNLPLFLILSLLCFATEWIVRKLTGLI